MSNIFLHHKKEFQFTRYPATENRSLKAWSAAEEHLLQALEDMAMEQKSIAIFNDRFGFLTCVLHQFSPTVILNYKSQEKSILKNTASNLLNINNLQTIYPLDVFKKERVKKKKINETT